MFKRIAALSIFLLVGLIGSAVSAQAQCSSYPYTLTNGAAADATQVMADFNCAALTSGATITGATLTGTTVLPGSGAITSAGNIGIGTTSPRGVLHAASGYTTVTASTSTPFGSGNVVIEGFDSTRSTSDGAALTFAIPANTDGSNVWEQGRIFVGPDNGNNGDANGRMYLQTRTSQAAAAWSWFNNLTLSANGQSWFDGSVGIGTNSPAQALAVVGNSGGYGSTLQVVNPGGLNQANITTTMNTWGLIIGSDTSTQAAADYHGPNYSYLINFLNAPLILGANNTAYVSIAPTGNVGIGTTTPAQMLEVSGEIRVDTLASASSTNLCINANVLSSCSSSVRYKENINDAHFGLKDVTAMRPVTFKWKGRDENDFGLIAEEVAKINPLFVTFKNGKIEGVKYTQLTAVLVNAVKELKTANDTLKAANDRLTAEITRLHMQNASVLGQLKRQAAEGQDIRIRLEALERRAAVHTTENIAVDGR